MKLLWIVGGREGCVIKIHWNGWGGVEKRVEWLTARFFRVFSISNSNGICFLGYSHLVSLNEETWSSCPRVCGDFGEWGRARVMEIELDNYV